MHCGRAKEARPVRFARTVWGALEGPYEVQKFIRGATYIAHHKHTEIGLFRRLGWLALLVQ